MPAKPKIVVIGSTNMDLVAHADRLPEAGETILGNSFFMNPGGKGANQAVACSRLGAETIFLTALGRDNFAELLLNSLKTFKVNTQYVKQMKAYSSGIALIAVDKKGENQIIVVPGANSQLLPEDIRKRKSIIAADMVLLQLEIPLETVCEAVKIAGQARVPVILNPAPVTKLPQSIFPKLSYITPNKTEAGLLTGMKVETLKSAEMAGKKLLGMGVSNALVTLGSEGVLVVTKERTSHIPAPRVKPMDTTAAGDAFNGGLAFALARGQPLEEAARFAVCAAAISVTRVGAQQSMPSLKDVVKFQVT